MTGKGYAAAVIGAFLISAAAASVISPWHAADTVKAPAPAAAHVVTAADLQRQLDDRQAAAMTRHDCTPPAMWKTTHPGQFPKSMLLKADGTFTLTDVAWTYPAPAGMWVMALCAR